MVTLYPVFLPTMPPPQGCLQYPPLSGLYNSSSLELQIYEPIPLVIVIMLRLFRLRFLQPVHGSKSCHRVSVWWLSCTVLCTLIIIFISTHSWPLIKAIRTRKQPMRPFQTSKALLFLNTMGPILLIFPLSQQRTSAVRLTLIELIHGLSMQKADPKIRDDHSI